MTRDENAYEDPPAPAAGQQDATAQRRLALGSALRIARGSRGWSVEAAAEKAGVGHMTLRRIEDGYAVRGKTYASLDNLLDLPPGMAHRATSDDAQLVELAGRVGIDVGEVTSGKQSPREFVTRLAPLTTASNRGSLGGSLPMPSADMHGTVTGTASAQLSGLVANASGRREASSSTLSLAALLLERMETEPKTELIEEAERALRAALRDLSRRPPTP